VPLRAPVRSTMTPPPQSKGEGRSIAIWILVCALAVLVLAGGAYGAIKYLTGKDSEPPAASNGNGTAAAPAAGNGTTASKKKKEPTGVSADVRAATNVSVLNGTGSNGLAAKVQQQLVSAGYKEGLRDNAQGGPTTVVYFQEGSRAAARDVARRLRTSVVKPIDPQTLAAGGTAKIVVILGQDQVR
jgi:hypothetical protein